MPTSHVVVDSTAYVEISTTDALVQNTSPSELYVIFADSLPAATVTDAHVLPRNQAIQKANDFPAGNIYARAARKATCKVAVST